MKLFIRRLFLFLLFSSIFYICMLFIWNRPFIPNVLRPNFNYPSGGYGHTQTRLNEVKTINTIDILFLGSSHTYRGFDPRIFKAHGFTSFNLGSSAQTPVQTEILLKRYLDKLNPKLIIYEIDPWALISDGIESSLDLISNDQNDLYSYNMAIKLNNIKTYHALLYGTTRDIIQLNNQFLEPFKKGKDTYISGGFVEKEIKYYEPVIIPKSEITVSKKQVEIFKNVINEIKKRKINLQLVYAPISKSLYSSYTNMNYFDSLISSQAQYTNFNKILNLKDSIHFYDDLHLNQNGVTLFNEKLINIIK